MGPDSSSSLHSQPRTQGALSQVGKDWLLQTTCTRHGGADEDGYGKDREKEYGQPRGETVVMRHETYGRHMTRGRQLL